MYAAWRFGHGFRNEPGRTSVSLLRLALVRAGAWGGSLLHELSTYDFVVG